MMHTMKFSKEHNLWTVGYYAPDYEWIPISDHKDVDDAKAEVSYLNGGLEPRTAGLIALSIERLADCVLGTGQESVSVVSSGE